MIIGDTFMTVTESAVATLKLNPNNVYLAQGTLRPDLIESGKFLSRPPISKSHPKHVASIFSLFCRTHALYAAGYRVLAEIKSPRIVNS